MKKNKILLLVLLLLLPILIFIGCQYKNFPTKDKEDDTDYSRLFELNVYSDKKLYQTTDKIQISATLKYIGENNFIIIWHGDPYITFKISDGENFNTSYLINTISTSTLLEKNKLYKFDYVKNGGYSKDDVNANYWRKFYQEKDLYLPKGEYNIKVGGAFSLSKKGKKSNNDLSKEINITVK